MSRLLTPFRASSQRVVEDYIGGKAWVQAWRTSAVWERTRAEAEAWDKEVQERAERGEVVDERDLVDLRLPTVEREERLISNGNDVEDPEISAVWGTIHGHVYEHPKDVFADWRPLAIVCDRVVVVDKYAVSHEAPREGDQTYAQSGLIAFMEFLDGVAMDPRRPGPQAFDVRFVTSKKVLERNTKLNQRERRDASDEATSRLRSWKGSHAPSVTIRADVLDEDSPGVGAMHDRYIMFISATSRWSFALGRGISAFANEHTPLSVSLVGWVPERWLREH